MTLAAATAPVAPPPDNYQRLIEATRVLPTLSVAVIHPVDGVSLGAALEAADMGLITPTLVGPRSKILGAAHELGRDISALPIVEAPHSHAAAEIGVELVKSGQVEALMKGSLHTDELMGAVVGRLQAAENTEDAPLVVVRDDGSLLVDGSLPNDDLRELLGGVALPDDDEYNTLAGMMIERFGRIPHVGERLDWAGWRFEVVDLDGARIDKLLLHRLPDADDEDLVA